MKALVLSKNIASNLWELNFQGECPRPTPGPFDLLLEVKSCCFSPRWETQSLLEETFLPPRFDSLGETNAHQKKAPMQYILGSDVSGVVIQKGAHVVGFEEADEVVTIVPIYFYAGTPHQMSHPSSASLQHTPAQNQSIGSNSFDKTFLVAGGFAEYCRVNYFDCIKKPPNISHISASASLTPSLRAFTAFHFSSQLLAGDSVLVFNAAQNHQRICLQILALKKIKIFAAVRNQHEVEILQNAKIPLCRIIDCSREDVYSICLGETDSNGVDCILDDGNLGFLSPNGSQIPAHENSADESTLPTNCDTCIEKYKIINLLAIHGIWLTNFKSLQVSIVFLLFFLLSSLFSL
eukprot:Sdes_comp20700_c0_seq9m16318